MKEFFQRKDVKAILNRAIRTIAQGMLATIGSTAVVLGDVDFLVVLSAGLMAGIVSILTSIAFGVPEAEGDN